MQWTNAALAASLCLLWGCSLPAPHAAPPLGGAAPAAPDAVEARRLLLVQALSKSSIAVVRNKDGLLQFNLPTDFAFTTDSADIMADMREELDQLAMTLNSPAVLQMRLLIVGYTDSAGPEAVNDRLSLARAQSVAKYVQAKGVDVGRITVEGRGARQPMASNDQSYGRALNRRVEIVLSEPASGPR